MSFVVDHMIEQVASGEKPPKKLMAEQASDVGTAVNKAGETLEKALGRDVGIGFDTTKNVSDLSELEAGDPVTVLLTFTNPEQVTPPGADVSDDIAFRERLEFKGEVIEDNGEFSLGNFSEGAVVERVIRVNDRDLINQGFDKEIDLVDREEPIKGLKNEDIPGLIKVIEKHFKQVDKELPSELSDLK